MDIEGEEYDVIFDTANETLKKFSIVHIHSNNNVVPIKHRGYEFPHLWNLLF